MSDIVALVNIMIKFTQPTKLSYSISHIQELGCGCPAYGEGQSQTLKCGNDVFALQGGPPPLYADAGIDES